MKVVKAVAVVVVVVVIIFPKTWKHWLDVKQEIVSSYGESDPP